MKLLDLITSPWALLPDQLREIQSVYATHLKGDRIDIAAIEARLGRPLASEQQAYDIRPGGVAVLTLEGVMAPKANLMMQISGGVSTRLAGLQVESAMADPRVSALVLAIDSPGGSVFGTPELAATVAELAKIKPIVAVTDGTLASAAYWVASAANAIYISGPTVQVGSIGVVASHNYDPRAGATTTEITAGKYKRIASNTGPLTTEGRAYLQGQVDHLYSVFVDTVATHRGTSTDAVLEHMADGRVFIGQQAIDRGLVDGYATLESIVSQLATDPQKFSTRRRAKFAPAITATAPGIDTDTTQPGALASAQGALAPAPVTPTNLSAKEPPVNRETLEKEHPQLLATLKSEFSAAASADGAASERARIAAVRAQGLPGHETLIETLAFDGKTTGPEAAMAVLAAERARTASAAAAHQADAPAPVPHAAAPADAALSPQAQAKAAADAVLATMRAFA